MIAKLCGGTSSTVAGAMTGYTVAGAGGALTGVIIGFALWFVGDTFIHAPHSVVDHKSP